MTRRLVKVVLYVIPLLLVPPTFATTIDPLLEYLAKYHPDKRVEFLACKNESAASCTFYNTTAGEILNLKDKYKYIVSPPIVLTLSVEEPLREIGLDVASEPVGSYYIWYNKGPVKGDNVRIAIIDTGVYLNHWWFKKLGYRIVQAVEAKYVNGECVYTFKGKDPSGHGTAVAGTIASVAPKSVLYVISIPTEGSVYKHYICALKYAAEHANIISISFALPPYWFAGYSLVGFIDSNPICNFINSRKDTNVFVVAAGNDGMYKYTVYGEGDSISFTVNTSVSEAFPRAPVYLIIKWNASSPDLKRISVYAYNASNLSQIVGSIEWKLDHFDEKGLSLLYYGCVEEECVMHVGYTNGLLEAIRFTIRAPESTEFLVYDLFALNILRIVESPINSIIEHTEKYHIYTYPAVCRYTITVGAWNTFSDNIAAFSSKGPNFLFPDKKEPTVVAPGVYIYVPIPGEDELSGKAVYASGTSLAAPIVAAVLAMASQYYGPLNYDKALQILQKYTTDKELPEYVQGYGLLNITKLLEDLPKLELVDKEITSTKKKIEVQVRNPSTLFPCTIKEYNITVGPGKTVSIPVELPYDDPGTYTYTLRLDTTCGIYEFPIKVSLITNTILDVSLAGWKKENDIYTLYYDINITNPSDFSTPVYLYVYVNDSLKHEERYLLYSNQIVRDRIILKLNRTESEVYKIVFVIQDVISNKSYNIPPINLSDLPPFVKATLYVTTDKDTYYIYEKIRLNITLNVEKYNVPEVDITYSRIRIGDILLENVLREGENVLEFNAYDIGVGTYDISVLVVLNDKEIENKTQINIIKPSVTCDLTILNTNDQQYYGTNSRLKLRITSPVSFNAILQSTFYNGTIPTRDNTFTLNLTEGSHNISYKLYLGRVVLCDGSKTIVIDKTLPTVHEWEIVLENGKVRAQATVSDNYCLHSAELYVNNTLRNTTTLSNTTESFSLSYSPETEGYYKVVLVVKDCANNTVSVQKNILYDSTPPVILVYSPNTTKYYAFGIPLNVGVEDYTETTIYINNTKYIKPFIYNISSPGVYIFNITAIDSANNTNSTTLSVRTMNFTKDTLEPLTVLYCTSTEYGILNITNSPDSTYTYNVTRDKYVYEYKLTEYKYNISTNVSSIYCTWVFVLPTGESLVDIRINNTSVSGTIEDNKVFFETDDAGILVIKTIKLLNVYESTTQTVETSETTVTTTSTECLVEYTPYIPTYSPDKFSENKTQKIPLILIVLGLFLVGVILFLLRRYFK